MFNSNAGIPVSIPLNTNGGSFGGNGFEDIIALAIIAMIFGWNGNGNGIFGGGSRGGSVADAYVLNSDFATIQRQLSDGFNSVDNALDAQNNGICNLGYTQLQLNNQLATQIADCCCKTQTNIKDTQYAIATTGANIQNQMQSCCCDIEKQNMQTNYNMATQNCATLQAIDKLGDRIIDRMNASDMAAKDAKIAEQACVINNQFLLSQINKTPSPAYVVPNPYCNCGGYGNSCY